MLVIWYNKTVLTSILTKNFLLLLNCVQVKKVNWLKPVSNVKIKLNKLNKFHIKSYFYYTYLYLWKFLPKIVYFVFSKKNKQYFIFRRMNILYLVSLYLFKYFNFLFLNNFYYYLVVNNYKFNYNINKYLVLKIYKNFYRIKFFYMTKFLPICSDLNLNFENFQYINFNKTVLLKINLTYLNLINIYKLSFFFKTKH